LIFVGAKAELNFDNVGNTQFPNNGVRFNMSFSRTEQLKTTKIFNSLNIDLALYKAIDSKENIVLATKAGTSHTFGNGYEFFQLPSIGGLNGLRGYRRDRFYGKNAFRHSTDLRFKINNKQFPNFPVSFGVFISFDYGRVWNENQSEIWHYNYGGGIWFSPMNLLLVNFGLHVPKEAFEESPRFTFSVGFDF
jgi:outer membrane protein assembly factor BamA